MTDKIVILTPTETARLLGISNRTLGRWHADRLGPPRVNTGRSPRYRLDAVMRWLGDNEVQPLHTFDEVRHGNA